MDKSITISVALFAVTLFLLSFTLSANAQILYSCESPFGEDNPFLHIINPNTGATISTTEITLAGQTVRGCNGMAKHPETGVCYVMLNITPRPEEGPIPPRVLATIDQDTGVATSIGGVEETFASIAFTPDGTLYGVTGDGGATPETLFTINILNGSPTFVTALGNGDDGEVLAFNPIDELIYHGSGNGAPYNNPTGQIFEAIDPNTLQITPRAIQGTPVLDETFEEQSSMVYNRVNNIFLTGTIDEIFFAITSNGDVTELGAMDHVTKGLAFDCGIPTKLARPIPTLSEWGLIAMAGILGFVGFMVIRRRKVAA